MGKSKGDRKKDARRRDQSVFRVATTSKIQKSKTKTKAVTTNIKKMNNLTKQQKEKSDATMKTFQVQLIKAPQKMKTEKIKTEKIKKPAKVTQEPVDMETAMEGMSKL